MGTKMSDENGICVECGEPCDRKDADGDYVHLWCEVAEQEQSYEDGRMGG